MRREVLQGSETRPYTLAQPLGCPHESATIPEAKPRRIENLPTTIDLSTSFFAAASLSDNRLAFSYRQCCRIISVQARRSPDR